MSNLTQSKLNETDPKLPKQCYVEMFWICKPNLAKLPNRNKLKQT